MKNTGGGFDFIGGTLLRLCYPNVASTDENSDDENPVKPKKYKLNPKNDNRYSKKPQTEQCHLCDFAHHRRILLYQHQKIEHPEYWAEKMANNPSWRGQTKKLILSDQYTEIGFLEQEQLYNCNLCGFTCKKPHQMKKHVDSVHRKEDHGVCGICGMKFKYAHTLRRHMKTHGDYAYTCTVCGKQFRDQWNYREVHLKKHHPEEYERVKFEHENRPKRKKLPYSPVTAN